MDFTTSELRDTKNQLLRRVERQFDEEFIPTPKEEVGFKKGKGKGKLDDTFKQPVKTRLSLFGNRGERR